MIRSFPLIIGIIAMMLSGCSKEDPKPNENPGKLLINLGMDIREHQITRRLKSTVSTDSFRVVIYHSDGSEVLSFDNASLMPDTLELEPGDYYLNAHSGNDLPAAFENPFYSGTSDVFTITSGEIQTVSVSCALSNTKVSVEYSDQVINGFDSHSALVSTALGSLTYGNAETRAGFFKPSPMDIQVELLFTGTDGNPGIKILSGSIPDPLPAHHYQVYVNVSPDQGSAIFQILLDDTPILTEIVEITGEDTQSSEGPINYGDLLITEIMANPSALSDSEGEYYEILNNSSKAINLEGLILTRNETDSHTIGDSIVLQPGDYYVLAKTETATQAGNEYIYGSSITLPNSGAGLYIYNADDGSGRGELIFMVDYSLSGFPVGTGASIVLNPSNYNAQDAVEGSSWCVSTSEYSTGDKGTPGILNDTCN